MLLTVLSPGDELLSPFRADPSINAEFVRVGPVQ